MAQLERKCSHNHIQAQWNMNNQNFVMADWYWPSIHVLLVGIKMDMDLDRRLFFWDIVTMNMNVKIVIILLPNT